MARSCNGCNGFTAVTREIAIFQPLQKCHLLSENDTFIFNQPSAVSVQNSVKIDPYFYTVVNVNQ